MQRSTGMKLAMALMGLVCLTTWAHGCEVIETYDARLGTADHFNSNGQRLTSAAAIIRQDRANYYVYGIQDSEDQDDGFFDSKANRARLEAMLNNGESSRSAINDIVNGTPRVTVTICRDTKRGGDYVNVDVQ